MPVHETTVWAERSQAIHEAEEEIVDAAKVWSDARRVAHRSGEFTAILARAERELDQAIAALRQITEDEET